MKKLINSPDTLIADALRGIEAAHPELRVDHQAPFIYRAQPKDPSKVALVSGGGTGHEPLHGGFVGPGMLDAAVAGAVFTSPTPDQILAAAQQVATEAGVLFIVKNYTGDIMNFEMAAELAEDLGLQVATVVVADDVAVEDSTYTAGRRGVGLTVLLEKIVGAAAESGMGLDDLVVLANRILDGGRSMGMALTSCTVPAAGKPTFDLPEDQMEIGIGIHGEPGRSREPVASAHQIARSLVEPILSDLDYAGHDVIVLLNGMGATPLLELYVMYAEVIGLLEAAEVRIQRALVGNYVTSLDMAGCSLTLLRCDDELAALWDAPVATPGLRWGR